VRVGGDRFDEAIINYIRRNYGMLIGEPTAEVKEHRIGLPRSEAGRKWKSRPQLSEGAAAALHHLQQRDSHPGPTRSSTRVSAVKMRWSRRPRAGCRHLRPHDADRQWRLCAILDRLLAEENRLVGASG
jgi:hypothetical protein